LSVKNIRHFMSMDAVFVAWFDQYMT